MPVSASIWATSAALRVASLNLCTDEYLLLLARPEEIVSVSRLAKDRRESPLWRKAAPFPGNRGQLEDVVALRPSLLLTMSGGGKSTGLLARRLGMATIDLPYPTSIADVEGNMLRIAKALGDPRRADAWRTRLRRLSPPPHPRDAIFLAGGGASISKGTIADQWMRRAGFAQRPLPAGKASLETLAISPPQVLLRSRYRAGQRSQGLAWLSHPLANPSRSKIVATDGRVWTCAGPLMVYEIERLRGFAR